MQDISKEQHIVNKGNQPKFWKQMNGLTGKKCDVKVNRESIETFAY